MNVSLFSPPFPSCHVCPPQLTLTPAQQQLLIQQAQAQLLAAAVQHSASQQNGTTGANISASAATPITQLPLSQPIQIAPVRHRAKAAANDFYANSHFARAMFTKRPFCDLS